MDIKHLVHYLAFALRFPLFLNRNPKFELDGNEIRIGDMILTEDQLEFFFSSLPSGRNVIAEDKYRWPNAVVQYRIDEQDAQDESWTKVIREGIKHWEQETCVRFEELDDDYMELNITYVVIVRGQGCYSNVGYEAELRGARILSIAYGCLSMGVVAHEIGHAIGFFHEQSRPDRDTAVTIVEKNIMVDNLINFRVETNVNYFGVPYDLDSVMHYPNKAFSVNGKYTIVTKDPFDLFRIGQRVELSFYDKKLGNIIYNCSESCSNPPKCLNEGYIDQYCKCVCPRGISGSTCQNGKLTIDLRLSCGYEIKEKTKISTPKNYPPDTNCVWVIRAPDDKTIEIRFSNFEIKEKSDSSNYCVTDHLDVWIDDSTDGDRYCGKELENKTITYDSKKVVLIFFAENPFPGFEADIDFI